MAKKKKTKKPVLDDEDDDLPAPRRRGRDFDDDDGPTEPKPPSKNDAYTGLSLLTTVALVGAAAFFYTDAEASKAQPTAAPAVTVPALAAEPVGR